MAAPAGTGGGNPVVTSPKSGSAPSALRLLAPAGVRFTRGRPLTVRVRATRAGKAAGHLVITLRVATMARRITTGRDGTASFTLTLRGRARLASRSGRARPSRPPGPGPGKRERAVRLPTTPPVIRGHRGRLRQRHAVAPGAAALRADHRPRARGRHGRPRPPAVRRRAAERRGQRPGPSDPGKRDDRLVLRRPGRDAERDRAVSARALARCRGHACLFPACRAAGRRAVLRWPRLGRSTGHAARLQRRLARGGAERLRSLLLQVGDADRRALRQRGPGCEAHAPARDRDGRAHSRRGWPPHRRTRRGPAHGRLPDQQRILRPRLRRPRGAGPRAAVRCSRGSRARATGRCNGSSSGGRSGCSPACAAWTGARATWSPSRPRSYRAGRSQSIGPAPMSSRRPGEGSCSTSPCSGRLRRSRSASWAGPCCEPGASPRIATRAPANAASSPTRSAPQRSPARWSHGLAAGLEAAFPGTASIVALEAEDRLGLELSAVCEASAVPVGGEASRLVGCPGSLARVYESGFAFAVESETRMRVDLPEVHDALAGACRSSTQRPCACPARAHRARSACSSPTSASWTSASGRMSPGMPTRPRRRSPAPADYEHEHAVATSLQRSLLSQLLPADRRRGAAGPL